MLNGERGMARGGGSEDVLYLDQQQGATLFHLKKNLSQLTKDCKPETSIKNVDKVGW